MQLLSRFRRGLAHGIRVPLSRLRVSLHVSDEESRHGQRVLARTLEHLLSRFPELSRFIPPAASLDPESCSAALEFAHDYLPLIYEGARETQLRRLLARFRGRVKDEAIQRQLTLEIARSDVRSGVGERATVLLDLANEDLDKLRADIDLFEKRYAAKAGLIPSVATWRKIAGDLRGQSLVAYFRNQDLRGKRVLHVAPEVTLRDWFRQQAGIEYVTLDPFANQVDLKDDLTALQSPDASYDLVICHRVLEHVLDDATALREIHRVLVPGGTLNFSVPQALNLDVTNEWVVPDTSHDCHVRQYGMDLDDRLRKAGFDVKVDRTLLDRTLDEHIAGKTYPLRLYLCTKAA